VDGDREKVLGGRVLQVDERCRRTVKDNDRLGGGRER